ncbi:hypothetical protein D1831_06860 [Lactiplantibacillus garii]|uniref:Cell surface protein n=2 Tax=Lactiplantibacillus garii TaxID=2306423 RepID=A0A426D7M3_9LACO|nr:hypothetical protein D1831_06860 [Lactiplantibacillus garii]
MSESQRYVWNVNWWKRLIGLFSFICLLIVSMATAHAETNGDVSIFKGENRVNKQLRATGNISLTSTKSIPYVVDITADGANLGAPNLSVNTTTIKVILKNQLIMTRGWQNKIPVFITPEWGTVVLTNNQGDILATTRDRFQLKQSRPFMTLSYRYTASFSGRVSFINDVKLTQEQLKKPLYIALAVYNNWNKKPIHVQALAEFDPGAVQHVWHPTVDRLYADAHQITGERSQKNSTVTSSVSSTPDTKLGSKKFKLTFEPGALVGQDTVTVKERDSNGVVGYTDVSVEDPFKLHVAHPVLDPSNNEIKAMVEALQVKHNENASEGELQNFYIALGKIEEWAHITIESVDQPVKQEEFMWVTDMSPNDLAQRLDYFSRYQRPVNLTLYAIHNDGYMTPSTTITFMSPPSWEQPQGATVFDFGTNPVPRNVQKIVPQAWPRMVVRHAASDQNWSVNVGASVERGIRLFYRKSDGNVTYLTEKATTKLDLPPAATGTKTTTTFGEDWYRHRDAQRDTGIFMELHPDVQVGKHKMAIQWVITDAP